MFIWGPFMIRADILVFILSSVSGFVALKLKHRGRDESVWVLDVYINALLIGFLAWKFAMIVFDPVGTFKHPLSLLYFTGGDKGILLGTALALFYIGFRLSKKREYVPLLMKSAALAFLAAGSVWHMFMLATSDLFEWSRLFNVLLHAVLFGWLWFQFGRPLRQLLSIALWFSILSIMIPFFETDRLTVLAGFSSKQIAFAAMAILAMVLDRFLPPEMQEGSG